MPSLAEFASTRSLQPNAGPAVSAIIVSHNSGADLAACVADIFAQDVPVEIIVVDNASSDGSVDDLPAHESLSVLRNPDNRGFAVACNQGAERAHAARLLFVNPDCRVPVDALGRLCQHLDGTPELGILGANLLESDGTPQAAAQRRTPVPMRAIRQVLGLDAPVSAGAATQTGPLLEVEATSGALMLMRRAVFDQLQGFDTRYVLHCEDLDLCRRALQAGYRIAIARDVDITHHKGTSSRQRPIWVEWQKHRGMWRYFRKFDAASSPFWLRLAVPLGILAHFPLAALRALWRR